MYLRSTHVVSGLFYDKIQRMCLKKTWRDIWMAPDIAIFKRMASVESRGNGQLEKFCDPLQEIKQANNNNKA